MELNGTASSRFRWLRGGVVASFAFLVAVWSARPWVIGDTPFVLDGTNAFIACVSRRDFDACGYTGRLDYWGLMSPIGDWPLLQHLPDLVAVELGATSHGVRTRLLALLGVVGVVAAVALARIVLSKVGQSGWFWGFLLVVVSGPLLFYAETTAGEALAAGLLVCLVAATVLLAPPPLVGLAALAASLTKETSYPFVAALGVLGLLLARQRTGRPIRSRLLWGAAGVAVGVVLASLFNVVRFGSVLNTNYLQPELHTPGLLRPLEYTLALFVSPNGGMLVFWPVASLLLLAACLVPLLDPSRERLDVRPALVLVGAIVALTLGFAFWWDPFGTFYGPRLAIPWVLPLVLIGLVAYGDALGRLTVRLLTPTWRFLLVFAVAFGLALPHVGKLWRPRATDAFFQNRKPPCDAPWRGGVEAFHACQHDRIWWVRPPLPAYSFEGVATVGGALTGLAVGLCAFGCLLLLREELPRNRRVERPGPAGDHGTPVAQVR